MVDEPTAPKDGNVYLRLTASLDWYVERWIDEYSHFNRWSAENLEEGTRLAQETAKASSVLAFLLDRSGGITLL